MRNLALWVSYLLAFYAPAEFLYELGELGSVGRGIGILLAGVWALSALIHGRVRQPGGMVVLGILFVLWCYASLLWTLDPEGAREQALSFVQLALLLLIVWDLYDQPATLERGLQAYLFGVWFCALTLIESYLTADLMRRMTVGLFNQNTLGFMLALALAPAWHLATSRDVTWGVAPRLRVWLRLSNFALIPVAVFGIFLTASRTSAVAAALALGYMAIGIGRLGRAARIAVFAAAGMVAAYGVTLIPETSLDRLESTTTEVGEGDWNGRLEIWSEALRIIADEPFLGVGLAGFHEAAVETNSAPHNFVLAILAELGLVGFLLYGGICVLAGLLALREPRPWALLWLTTLAVWLLHALTHNFEDKKITWLMFGWIAVSAELHRRRVAQPAAQPRAAPVPSGLPTSS